MATQETVEQRIARLEAENLALRARENARLTFKVSEKGACSVYGLGRWPVTLYRSQWTRLLDSAESIKAFLVQNAEKLSEKAAV